MNALLVVVPLGTICALKFLKNRLLAILTSNVKAISLTGESRLIFKGVLKVGGGEVCIYEVTEDIYNAATKELGSVIGFCYWESTNETPAHNNPSKSYLDYCCMV